MIQLYKRDNTNFDKNGDYILQTQSCVLEQKLNDSWQLTLEYQFDDSEIFKQIINDAVISVKTTMYDNELFRIYATEKTETGITAYARPIFFDAAKDTMIMAVSFNNTGKEAAKTLCSGTRYTVTSDILDRSPARYVRKNLIEALASDDEGSFLNLYGGEMYYHNYSCQINKKIGRNRGVKVEFGRNLKSIKENIDYDGLVTRIVPVGYNGYTLSGSSPWVDSANINKYATVHTKVIEYSDVKLQKDCSGEDETGFATLSELQEELKKRAKAEFDNDIDLPNCNYSVDMIDLSKTEEYKDYSVLERVELGDTLVCSHRALGIQTSGRVISVKYNCITERNDEIELGDFIPNYLDDMQSTLNMTSQAFNHDGSVKGESISGLINLMQTKLQATHDIAKKQTERAILFEDRDSSSDTFGAMALGTTGFEIASQMNMDGTWNWTTFGTGEGFMADCIIAGVLYSQNFVGGSQGCKFDLNNGYIEINNGRINITSDSYTDDRIRLKYSDWEVTVCPLELRLHNVTTGYSTVIQAGGYFIYDKDENQIGYLGQSGVKTTGGITADGDIKTRKELWAEGETHLKELVHILKNADISGALGVNGKATIGGKLTVAGGICARGWEGYNGYIYLKTNSGEEQFEVVDGIVVKPT